MRTSPPYWYIAHFELATSDTLTVLVIAAPSCTSRIAPFVPVSRRRRYAACFWAGTTFESIVVPAFTISFAGAVLFALPTIHVLFDAVDTSFATSHSPAQM